MICVCGYASGYHDEAGRCPLCACGLLPAEHEPVWVAPPPLLAARSEHRCPGKSTKLRRGSFREPAPSPRYRWRSDGVMVPILDEPEVAEDAPAPPPLVPARHTVSLDEIPRQATPLGRLAADLGWRVDPWYWQAADSTETGLLLLQRAELRAYAQWDRAPGATWRTGGAWAWRAGEWPAAVGVKRLTDLIRDLGKP